MWKSNGSSLVCGLAEQQGEPQVGAFTQDIHIYLLHFNAQGVCEIW